MAPIWCHGWGNLQLHPEAVRAFTSLFIGCIAATGVQLSASSPGDAYRSLQAQTNLFLQRYTPTYLPLRNTLTSTRTYQGSTWYKRVNVAACASPGTSNHGFGIALDTAIFANQQIKSITSNTTAWSWVQSYATQYGLSWESQSEAWHLRLYAGDKTAQRVLDTEAFFHK